MGVASDTDFLKTVYLKFLDSILLRSIYFQQDDQLVVGTYMKTCSSTGETKLYSTLKSSDRRQLVDAGNNP